MVEMLEWATTLGLFNLSWIPWQRLQSLLRPRRQFTEGVGRHDGEALDPRICIAFRTAKHAISCPFCGVTRVGSEINSRFAV